MNSFKSSDPSPPFDNSFFEKVAPIKLTESKQLKYHTKSWGFLTEYYLESVKVNGQKSGAAQSIATLRIGDKSGHVTCVVRGHSVGLLFGLSVQEWAEVEKLCDCGQQLFYRYFKNGLNENYCYEQRLFYNFCMNNQKKDCLVAVFCRRVNMRLKDNNDAFIEVLELRKVNNTLLDLYVEYLGNNANKL